MAARMGGAGVAGIGCLAASIGLIFSLTNEPNTIAGSSTADRSSLAQTATGPIDGAQIIYVGGRGASTYHTLGPRSDVSLSDSLIAGVFGDENLKLASAMQRQGAIDTILAQLNAFRSGNFEKADSYQAKSMRANFGSTRQFRILMSRIYPEFTSYQAAHFGGAKIDKAGQYLAVPVTLTGEDGVTVQAVYVMRHEKGNYRVLTVVGGMNPHPEITTESDLQMT